MKWIIKLFLESLFNFFVDSLNGNNNVFAFEFSDKVKEIFPEAHICKDRRSITLNFEDEEPGSEETGEN